MNWGENNRVDHFAVCHSAGCYTHANPVNPVIVSSTSYVYDQHGRQIETIDALNQSTHTVYDLRGNVIRQYGTTYPVWYEYDADGRKVAMATSEIAGLGAAIDATGTDECSAGYGGAYPVAIVCMVLFTTMLAAFFKAR